jgi:alpha-N-acetylglucosaminidase
MALRGINLALAWTGVEAIFISVFQDIGLTDAEIDAFLSGPAFLAWNHMGNIQGSWGGSLPRSWVDEQFEMQKKILARMGELGITPILPAFAGFVPAAITRVWPDANVTNGSVWEGFPEEYTADTFLDPLDPRFAELQTRFIAKQQEAYGNVTHFYALDQFNENNPASGNSGYLYNVSHSTWASLKAADPDAVWVLQGWLFASNAAFWTNPRIEAFLSGVPADEDMLVLDLFSESSPQWQRTSSYYGKPWVWCQLHNYGGNMGLYGQIENITINPVAALRNVSATMVGMGLAMEGQEGNEVVYDLLLDQAWSEEPIDTEFYFEGWVTARYEGGAGEKNGTVPPALYDAWDMVRSTVYNNTHLVANAVPKAIFELVPSISGLVNRTGHHPTMLNYDTAVLVRAWHNMYAAGLSEPTLFAHPAYRYDLADWTRQVLANAFIPMYEQFIFMWNTTTPRTATQTASLQTQGAAMLALLLSLDAVLATDPNFRLSTWLAAARASATAANESDARMADFMEYQARNQVTLWGPTGQVSDYASKSWAGLVSGYYVPRWRMFVEELVAKGPGEYNQTGFEEGLVEWDMGWVNGTDDTFGSGSGRRRNGMGELKRDVDGADDLKKALEEVVKRWNGTVFSAGMVS